MIVFYVLKVVFMLSAVALFVPIWFLAGKMILATFVDVGVTFPPYTAKSLEQENKRWNALRRMEDTPSGLRLNRLLQWPTAALVLLVLTFGVEAIVVAATSLERVGF